MTYNLDETDLHLRALPENYLLVKGNDFAGSKKLKIGSVQTLWVV